MRVVVDYELCESNAICMALVPTVFELQADDQLHLLDETPDESLRAELRKAVDACPRRAITVEG